MPRLLVTTLSRLQISGCCSRSRMDAENVELLQSMRTLVQQMDPAAKNIDDADLRRFLHARDFNVRKAAKFFVQHLKWKQSFLPHGCVQEAEITTELQRKQVFLQGHNKIGCPIIVILTARHITSERDLEEIKRLFIYTFDKASASNLQGQDKFVIIGDLAGWGLRNMDIRGYLAVLDILQNHYPERLQKLFLLHVPYLFWGAWKVVSPLVDKATRRKIVFVQDQSIQETLLQEVSKDQLPDIYGGEMELVPVQDSRTANLPSNLPPG